MSNDRRGCTIFIGNIDFDVTEDQIIKELSAVGEVVNYRHMYDKQTGKSRGFGFAEYHTPEIAALAMKKLKIKFNDRLAKINYAENDLPTRMPVEENETREEYVVEQIVKSSDPETLIYLKKLAMNQPDYLKQLLSENPGLVCTCMQMLLENSTVKQDVIDLMLDGLSVVGNKDQIDHRIKTMISSEMENVPEVVKQKLIKIKLLLSRK